MRVVVLGCGMVGSAIARDLAGDDGFEVLAVDVSGEALCRVEGVPGLGTCTADLSGGRLAEVLDGADMAVGAVPGHMGFDVVSGCLQAGVEVVDISFFPEDHRPLDRLARDRGLRCLVDMGVAPGCSNLVCGREHAALRRMDRFSCMVGGLPELRTPPWEYFAPFSPSDVLEEYTRPARYRTAGRVITEPALSRLETVSLPGVGELEAFLTDGLRSLLLMEDVPEMVEKTLRYPGYREKVALLRDTGFLDGDPVTVDGVEVVPMELTSVLLGSAWRQGPGDRDLTVMRIEVEGVGSDGGSVRRVWDLLDRFDDETGTSSMARTTGYTCAMGVRMLASGLWDRPGAYPPEAVGASPECFDMILSGLAERGVLLSSSGG